MRIIYCLDEMSHPGGIGRVTSVKASWLAERGNDVYIVTANQCGEPDYYPLHPSVSRKDFAIGFQAEADNANLLMKFLRKIGKMRRYRRLLEAFIREIRPDIVVSTFTNDSDFLYKLNDGSHKILEFHFSHDGFKSQMKYGRQTLKNKLLLTYRLKKHERIAKKYETFVVLTHEDAQSWRGYSNLHVIPNMLSFHPQTISSCSEKRVIAVGRLDFQKKFDRLIDIWALVNKECPDWKLDIFGQGADEQSLRQQIARLDLNHCVSIKKPTKEIEKEYASSSILALTSTYEGLVLTLLEAMSVGIPCVAYACKCGPRDVIDNGKTGYIIEEDDKEAFAKSLVALIKDEEMRKTMGRNAKESAKKYDVDTIMEQWQALFSQLLQQ